jgi:pSer/pThr/pTyr-binding forkhead associated (FHA) protein
MTGHLALNEISTGREYALQLPCVIGRSADADLIFSDPSISQRHARLEEHRGEIWIEDLKSANGVYVNGQRIAEKVLLKSGDLIQLGRSHFQLATGPRAISQKTLVLDSLDFKLGWTLDHERLRLLYEITTDLSENLDLPVLAGKIFARLKDIFRQDRSHLAIFRENGSLEAILVDPPMPSFPISTSITDRILQNGESLLLEDALNDNSLQEHESAIAPRIRSTLCVPLIYHNQIHGLIYLGRNVPGAYHREDLELLRTIGFILGPLIENARLWSELKNHYANAVNTLRETQARLLTVERMAAYVRLAQAMAHEIRNPLTAIGGLVRRMAQPEADRSKVQKVVTLVERVETILTEVDTFVKLPSPTLKLERIDHLIREVIDGHTRETSPSDFRPFLAIHTSRLMIPVDGGQFKKGMSLIFNELQSSVPQGSHLAISLRDSDHELEIVIGGMERPERLCDAFAPELASKPWSLGLFLTMAHKIIADHRGKLLLDPAGHSVLPMVIRMPRSIIP